MMEHNTINEDILDVLLQKKINEFMEYQKYICERINKLVKELFPPEIINVFLDYQSVNNRFFTTKDLWIRCYTYYAYPYNIEIELNPNDKDNVSTDNTRGNVAIYNNIKTIRNLQLAIIGFKNYERLLELLETKAPQMIKNVVEWKRDYVKDSMDYLNSLDFSIPGTKTKHYVVTVKIEEIED